MSIKINLYLREPKTYSAPLPSSTMYSIVPVRHMSKTTSCKANGKSLSTIASAISFA